MNRKVTIDNHLFETFPDIRLGLLEFNAIVKKPDTDFWNYMETEILPEVRKTIERKEWGEISGVRGSRAAYKAFGRNPGRYRVSSEALLRRVRRGDELYRINSVVDVNNLISVTGGLSIGSYDIDKIQGSITFRKATEGEGYTGIGKNFLDMENMLVLADEQGIFGSSMSDSTRAMVTENTTKVLTVIYCFEKEIDLEKLLDEAEQAFVRFAGVTDVKTQII